MGYTREFNLNEISKGRKIRRVPLDSDEYFEVGDFHPEVDGWEIRPDGRNTFNWDGILIYVRPKSIKDGFELFIDDV